MDHSAKPVTIGTATRNGPATYRCASIIVAESQYCGGARDSICRRSGRVDGGASAQEEHSVTSEESVCSEGDYRTTNEREDAEEVEFIERSRLDHYATDGKDNA